MGRDAGPRVRITWVVDPGVRRPRLGVGRLTALLGRALAESGPSGVVLLSVRLVDDATAAALHGEHFSDPTTTDVMTFPDGSWDPGSGALLLGDLAVCVDVARREAKARGRSVADELILYILHGVLHLLDYDDRTPAQRARMWARQRELLATIGIALEEQPS